jgi:hypothetical protein
MNRLLLHLAPLGFARVLIFAAGVMLNGQLAAQQSDFDEAFKKKKDRESQLANVPGSMQSRMDATRRGAAMQRYGGKEKSEKAVLLALRWLRDHQNEDGSWSNECKPAMTGLALLCFLGHGELPASPEFGAAVMKAVEWLLARGTEFGGRMSLSRDGWGNDTGAYQHAIVTLAMCEYHAMTQDNRFSELIAKAVTYIVDGQNPRGGWDLSYNKGVRSDLSVTSWQVQALHAAHLAKLKIRGVEEALDKSVAYVKSMQIDNGRFGYEKPDDRGDLTGAGVFCTYLWKQDKDKVVREGIDYLLGHAEVKYDSNKADIYAWYFDTQACFIFGGSAWTKWNRMFQDEIAGQQSADGSWRPPIGGEPFETKRDGAGPMYRTTLCTLMLEVFYRYGPEPARR